MAAVIETRDLAVAFGNDSHRQVIFEQLNLRIERGELVTLVGVSGAGKSTLLRVIAGLMAPSAGTVSVDPGKNMPHRPIAMVFQAAQLMPWRSIARNVMLGIENMDMPAAAQQERVRKTLELVGLAGFENRWPHQLSGGQRQRIGLARALAVDPDILLMDEPFGALDAITRTAMQDELLRIWQETGKSILFVTHDIEEAVYLGDRVLLLGDRPAHIVNEYRVTLDRGQRRSHPQFRDTIETVTAGLSAAMALSDGGEH